MTYVLVQLPDDIKAPMATVAEALQAAGVPVEHWQTHNLVWVLDDAKRMVRDLNAFTEALSILTQSLSAQVEEQP